MLQTLLRHTGSSPTGNISLSCSQVVVSGFNGLVEIAWPCSGIFSHLVSTLTAAPGTSNSRTLTLYVNQSATALSVTHGATSTNARDTTNPIAINAGDIVRMVGSQTGSPTASEIAWTIEFESDDDVTSGYGVNISTTQSGFVDPFTGRVSATALDCQRLIPCNGILSSFVGTNTFGGVTAGNALRFYWYKNGVKQDGTGGTVDTLLTVTDIAQYEAVTANFSLGVVRGDRVYVGIEETGTYPNGWTSIGAVFQATTPDQSIVASYITGNPSDTSVGYGVAQGDGDGSAVWGSSVTFNNRLICGVATVTLSQLILEASDDPGAGNTRTFELRNNGAVPSDTPQGVISTGVLTFEDNRSAVFTDAQTIGPMQHTPASTPTVTGREWWSMVMGVARIPPEDGGEIDPGPTPEADTTPAEGIIRLFARLTFVGGSPATEIKITETPFFFDPSDWYGGYGHPWLISVSEITRVLSDSLQGTEVTLRVADPDRYFRTLATTNPISGSSLELFLVSDTTRYALGVPHRRFAGIVHVHRALPGMEYELSALDVLSVEMMLADSPVIPPARMTSTLFPGMTTDYEGRHIPIAMGEVSDESETVTQGVVPPMIVAPVLNLQDAFGGTDVDVVAAIVSHGALPPNGLWTGYYNTVDDPYTRIPIPAAAWGTLLTAPGMPGWDLVGVAEDYIDYPSDPTLTHRYTPVFFLASDPNVQAVLDRRIQVAFNVYGVTDQPDGSGAYFADAPDIYEFLLRNYLYAPHWRYGAYNDLPVIAGYSIIDAASVATTRSRLRSFGGGSYPVGFLLGRGGQPQTLRHVLTELAFGVLMEQGTDRHGRILIDVEDPNALATLNLSDVLDIEDGQFDVWVDRASYRTSAEYFFGYRYLPAVAPLPTPPEGETLPVVNLGPHQDWQSIGTHTHEDAITANNGLATPPMRLENYVVRNSDVASNWVERIVDRAAGPSPTYDGARIFRISTSWQALDVELGDVIAIDHIDGLGASGFEGQRGRVLRITDDLQNARITIEGRLLYGTGSPA